MFDFLKKKPKDEYYYKTSRLVVDLANPQELIDAVNSNYDTYNISGMILPSEGRIVLVKSEYLKKENTNG